MSEIALSDGKWDTIPLSAGDPQDRVARVAKWVNVLDSSAILSCGCGLAVGPLAQKTPTPTPSFAMAGDSSSHRTVISSFSILNCQAYKMPVLVAEILRFRKKQNEQNMALWILCDRFFLQLRKAICIHLISEALVIGGY